MCVQEALEELALWLDAHLKEIVIVSCSHFDSLTDGDHAHLVELILRLFGGKLCGAQVNQAVPFIGIKTCRSRRFELV